MRWWIRYTNTALSASPSASSSVSLCPFCPHRQYRSSFCSIAHNIIHLTLRAGVFFPPLIPSSTLQPVPDFLRPQLHPHRLEFRLTAPGRIRFTSYQSDDEIAVFVERYCAAAGGDVGVVGV